MLVKDVRKEIEKYNKLELTEIIVELYKRIPKSKKEEYNIDDFIRDAQTKKKKVKKEVSFIDLQKEIIYFLECVDKEYYVIPNKIISKKERSAWRFKVKRYYKELNHISPNSPNGGIATVLLIELFKRLSIGSVRLLFVNWETFRALGVSQSDYYDTLMKRILYCGYTKENLKKCVNLLSVDKDPYQLSYDMCSKFISNLKTVDMKEDALEILKEEVIQLKNRLLKTKNNSIAYEIEVNINNYVECILEINLLLNEFEMGINYFHKNYIESDKEIKEYILLNKLDELDLKKEWIKEYEQYMNKIDYRDSLVERYEELKWLS